MPNEDSCAICTTNTFQNINGQNACKNCPIGKFTKLVGLQAKNDNASDCWYPPRIISLTPNNSTEWVVSTSFYGEHFGSSSSRLTLKVGGTAWEARVMNSTWIKALSSPGSGGHLNIEVVIDGILGTSIVNFSYTPRLL